MTTKMMKRPVTGFTLIELMVTVAVVAIVAAVAYPSYMSSVKKTRRADAQAVLMGFSQAMERHFTERNTYEGAATAGDTGTPAIYPSQAPLDGGQKYYDLSIIAADSTAYTLRATPINRQNGDGYLEISNTGLKSWDSNDDGSIDAGTENTWRQ